MGDAGRKTATVHAATATPFWGVVLQALESSNTFLHRSIHRNVIAPFYEAGLVTPDGIGSSAGSFHVLASKTTRLSEFNLRRPAPGNTTPPAKTQGAVQLHVRLLEHPKARFVGRRTLTLDEAVDDTGKVYKSGPTDRPSFAGDGDLLDIGQVSAEAKILKSVKGNYRIGTLLKTEMWEVPLALDAKDLTKTRGDWTFRVLKIVKNANDYVVHLTIANNAPAGVRDRANNSMMHDAMWLTPYEDVNLLDVAGKKLELHGTSSTGEGDAIKLELTFGRNKPVDNAAVIGEPIKLVWEQPVEVAFVSVPFEFKDIPLP
jgi:hypothetical protein